MRIFQYSVTEPIENFTPNVQKYQEVTLIDAYESYTHNLVQAFLKLGAPVTVFRAKEVTVSEIENLSSRFFLLIDGTV